MYSTRVHSFFVPVRFVCQVCTFSVYGVYFFVFGVYFSCFGVYFFGFGVYFSRFGVYSVCTLFPTQLSCLNFAFENKKQ